MTDVANSSTVNIALFVIQIVSAASGFVIAASCLFLRKWHPPLSYTAAFHISFWIGVQAMITHTGSAISVRLPDSSDSMQRNKPLVRFLVWAQFAMPLWFVFLNVAIATDLMLSQLFRLSAFKLQKVHKWYLPVTTGVAFALALPLLVYHSAYRPEANVFSVQFPSALSVTLYYILAFDIWLAIGIVYCFIVVSVVVGVLLLKLRRKRAAWRLQNNTQCTWLPLTPVDESSESVARHQLLHAEQTTDTANAYSGNDGARSPKALESAGDEIEETDGCEDSDGHIDPNQVRTFMQPLPPLPVSTADARKTLSVHVDVMRMSAISRPPNPSDTLMSGVTFNEDTDIRVYQADRPSSTCSDPNAKQSSIHHQLSERVRASTVGTYNPNTYEDPGCLPFRTSNPGKQLLKGYQSLRKSVDSYRRSDPNHITTNPYDSHLTQTQESPGHRESFKRRFLPKLGSLPPQLTLRSKNRLLVSSNPMASPFRIPTLALFRLLLYPLIPIFSFTLMCVVRWVWFRSTMPSRWEILNVVSGFLRALEGFLCLIVFFLNPALNRSFREIRKRNTPVYSQ
ncbi:hypothetical protein IW148_002516 [Coemansia sp. RSA 1199]|nr:hypothetical protein IW148_002516 [Coemansia sp. RSA 1199]